MALAEDRAARVTWDAPAGSGIDPDALVVETVRRHADQALRVARRFTDNGEDALDAYGRALVQLVRHRARLRPVTVQAWLMEVVRREALAVREQRRRLVPVDEETLVALGHAAGPSAEERVLDLDVAARATEALGALKPDEARALTLQAAGLSYADIAERLTWSATKTNRALTEGRRRFRQTFAELESGQACRRWAPVIAGRREARPADRARLRVHLRNCPGCRATARALHDTPSVLALVLPVALAAGAGGREPLGRRLADAAGRFGETLAAGVADRATGAAIKLQALAEAASAAKLAAVAASAVAVTGGGVAVREAAQRDAARPAPRAAAALAAPVPVASPRVPAAAAAVRAHAATAGGGTGTRAATAARRRPHPRAEFGGARTTTAATGGGAGEFAGRPAAGRSFETAAPSATSGGEFGSGATAAPAPTAAGGEFGG